MNGRTDGWKDVRVGGQTHARTHTHTHTHTQNEQPPGGSFIAQSI